MATKNGIAKVWNPYLWQDGTYHSSPEWILTWSDEFDGPAGDPPNSANWDYEIGMVRNSELQYYTNRTENARLSGSGTLIIEARVESYLGASYTSASLITKNKQEFLYGRIEARVKLPAVTGAWPAFWTQGISGSWPARGEIDIMEYVGKEPNNVYVGTVHASAGSNGAVAQSISTPTGWHVFALEWFADRLDFYFDSTKVRTYNNAGTGTAQWPFDALQYLLLNLAVGGSWGGPTVNDAAFPIQYEIDYVRRYQQAS